MTPPPPAISTSSPLPPGTQGVAYSQQLSATGGTGSYSWGTIAGSWPPGITLSGAGVVSGTPTATGTFSATVQVTSGGQTGSRTFELTVNTPVLAIATTSPLPDATRTVAYSRQLVATGGTGSYSWSTTAGSWPPGISLSGAGVVSGTATATGTFNATAQVTSGGQTASRAYQLTVVHPPLVIVTTSPLPGGTQGVPYSQQLVVTGGTGTYSWTVSGPLPPGITFSSAGLLSGTPAATGTYNFTAQVSSGGQTASRGYQLTISPPPPSITTTSPLPGGTQGVLYTQQLNATGGTGSYSWTTTAGSWPPGISLSSSGVVSGTPTASGTFNATAQVSSGGQTASRSFQLTIAAPVTYRLTLDLYMQSWQQGVTVSSSPSGLSCSLYYGPGGDADGYTSCSANFASGVQVTLTPNYNGDWTGCDSIGTNNSCRVTIGTANRSVQFIAY
jgi:hypothetical protein